MRLPMCTVARNNILANKKSPFGDSLFDTEWITFDLAYSALCNILVALPLVGTELALERHMLRILRRTSVGLRRSFVQHLLIADLSSRGSSRYNRLACRLMVETELAFRFHILNK